MQRFVSGTMAMFVVLTGLAALGAPKGLTAKWIWAEREDYSRYNDFVIARKTFFLTAAAEARVMVTADTRYRLYINGEWVSDGPCRSWPGHYQYDVLDVTPYVRPGENEVRVIANYFGTGTFHQVPQQAGLLFQLDVTGTDGARTMVASDGSWEVADLTTWSSNVPKKCVQMGPFELYDARQEGELRFAPAVELFKAGAGPWQDLNPRDVALLTREPFHLRSFQGANVVAADWRSFGFRNGSLLYPGLSDTNHATSMMSAVSTLIRAGQAMTLHVEDFGLGGGYRYYVNGKESGRALSLVEGDNFLLAVIRNPLNHWQRDTAIRFVETEGYALANPIKGAAADPWCFVAFEDTKYVKADYAHNLLRAEGKAAEARFRAYGEAFAKKAVDGRSLKREAGAAVFALDSSEQVSDDAYWQFENRRVKEDAAALVEEPGALMYDNAQATVVRPSRNGDIELIYDFGEQNCGYYEIDLVAEAGLQVDLAQVEYITPTGRVQHTGPYRNSMRYVCKEGRNTFLSFSRRSGRYLFITLRNQTQPVRIRNIRLIESTYPVEPKGYFTCSDPRLDTVWEISARTLKLCMEDTFTDCPLYEQTLWVGDARNEAVFAFTVFGAEDLARRGVILAGQSLEQYPMILCQVPSTWERLLPAWSFLWGRSVWDYYFYTGDRAFLEETWPMVVKNLEGAAGFTDERGMFSGPFWNMFDWSGIDDEHETVLHLNMLLVGAIDDALKCAAVLGEDENAAWLRAYRKKVVQAVNATWDENKQSYPDSIHNDGSVSAKTSMHTSFLALLHNVVEKKHRHAALSNILSPPDGMTRVGAPFAIMYLFEALEKEGYEDKIIELIYEQYQPMLDLGATTVWESFASGTTGSDEFPTRSHTHAWSSAPIHFLNRIVLGIVQSEAGGKAFTISPRLNGLTWVKGASASVNGVVEVSWHLEGKTLLIEATGPEGVALNFATNDSLDGLSVTFNGDVIEAGS